MADARKNLKTAATANVNHCLGEHRETFYINYRKDSFKTGAISCQKEQRLEKPKKQQ
ncbi:hypothetical protein [Desulfotalea psychrophila]|uniref:hypothetical protein n=1 Tax=Desulfotalea psychrophila TaxID=84980 RepID=UPI0002D6D104|nr:hypothetical protein [Desulfotalea psychrophila]